MQLLVVVALHDNQISYEKSKSSSYPCALAYCIGKGDMIPRLEAMGDE